MDRRTFLFSSASAVYFGGHHLMGAARAQGMEEVIVYPPAAETGTSIYDGSRLVQLAKFGASFASGASNFLSGIQGSLGAGLIGVAIVDPELASRGTILAAGGVFVISSGIWYAASGAWGLLAADPPRTNYRENLCSGSILQFKLPAGANSPAAVQLNAELDAMTTALRHLWDCVELWQGAELARDKAWMQIHYDGAEKSYAQLYSIAQRMPLLAQAMLKEFNSVHAPVLNKVFDATEKMKGRAYSDVPALVDVAKGFDAGLSCQKGVPLDFKTGFLNQKIVAVQTRMFDEAVRQLSAVAALLKKPN